jgi:hypothetical protein
MTKKKRVGVLISGRGSNLQALINACKKRDYPAEIVLVISNVPQAQGLLRAEAALIPTLTIDHKDFPTREDFDAALDAALTDNQVELLCNAGFMRLHTAGFVAILLRRWRLGCSKPSITFILMRLRSWLQVRSSLKASVCLIRTSRRKSRFFRRRSPKRRFAAPP